MAAAETVFLVSITGEASGEGSGEGDRGDRGDRGSELFIEGEIGEESVEGFGCAARADQRAARAARPSGRLAGRGSFPSASRCGGSGGVCWLKGFWFPPQKGFGLKRDSTPETASRKESRKRRRRVRTAKNRSP
jgi:hypothetical protein